MGVELRKCPTCGKWMLERTDPFPIMDENGEDLQLQRVGWVHNSDTGNNTTDYICEECEMREKTKFGCAICGWEHPASGIQESFGCPAEHLCKECYSEISAKQWDIEKKRLEEKHKWDWE
jgi:hypothetical protein